jgi:hypothetical protein
MELGKKEDTIQEKRESGKQRGSGGEREPGKKIRKDWRKPINSSLYGLMGP